MSIILHKIWTLFELKYTCPAFIMQIWRRYMSARVTLILINEEYQIMTGDIVYKDLIQLDLDVRNTDELFEVMAGRLMELGYVTGDFLESIKEREKEYPTALPIEPYAVAIPHTDPGMH